MLKLPVARGYFRLGFIVLLNSHITSKEVITARKQSLGQGNIFTSVCQEFCSWGEYLGRYTPQDQVHPLGPGIPPRTRYTPQDQVHPPGWVHPPSRTRYTPRDQVHPPGPDTPLQDQVHHPWNQVHPPGPGTPRPGTPPRAVHAGRYGDTEILECILVLELISNLDGVCFIIEVCV